ncbi:VOC family protein [Devosia sp. A16]|uniref:VOC family protein n=1 Tax=Devosia sp. A16 TaxID=1736675 RepID=UPI0006D7C38B|nr:VOC family protein [Devosia sp. A16]
MLPSAIEVVTLFVDDLEQTRRFYEEVFAPQVLFEDEAGAVLQFAGMAVNLLRISDAPELVTPRQVGARTDGPRVMFTVKVEDCRAAHAELTAKGIAFLNGPIDRPWGRRTAAFADPSGNVWEIAEEIR